MTTDLVDRLEEELRRHLLGELPADPSGELAAQDLRGLLIVHANWRARRVSPRPRCVHRSTELGMSPGGSEHRAAIGAIAADIEAGNDLNPRLSRRIDSAYVPVADRPSRSMPDRGDLDLRHDLDLLLADWGIHHFHLSTRMRGGRARRTRDLLFAAFRSADAYLIGVYPHGDWAPIDAIRTVVRNWPDAGIVHGSRFVLGLATPVRDDDRLGMRAAGINAPIEIDGTVYLPPGLSGAGSPLGAADWANRVMDGLLDLRRSIADNPTHLREFLPGGGAACDSEPDWQPLITQDQFGFVDRRSDIFLTCGSLPP